jgi:hypothetical protein
LTAARQFIASKKVGTCEPINVDAPQLIANHHERTDPCEAGKKERCVKNKHSPANVPDVAAHFMSVAN